MQKEKPKEKKRDNTFQAVGIQEGLNHGVLKRYVLYMKTRWASEEELQCQCGYAREWALRFKCGEEYGASDMFGQLLLREMAKKDYKIEEV